MPDTPMPGQVTFTADEEQAMRAGMAAQNAAGTSPATPSSGSNYTLTPKGRATMQGVNAGTKLPDDAIDRQ
jgi:hypothetical protein